MLHAFAETQESRSILDIQPVDVLRWVQSRYSHPESQVIRFGELTAIVIERYDRLLQNDRFLRIHQEDACQALAIHPARKYQSDSGPGITELMDLLNRSSNPVEDRRRFMDTLVFNYLILGTDAHAKNFSLLLGKAGQVRLARLYDIASLLPYSTQRKEQRFAMKIGGYYKDAQIRPRHFEKLARACQFPFTQLRESVQQMSTRTMECVPKLASELEEQGVSHPAITRLVSSLEERVSQIRAAFA
jgi:serine/threonine-protein kinase HipA